jgi:hypothetical protein
VRFRLLSILAAAGLRLPTLEVFPQGGLKAALALLGGMRFPVSHEA